MNNIFLYTLGMCGACVDGVGACVFEAGKK